MERWCQFPVSMEPINCVGWVECLGNRSPSHGSPGDPCSSSGFFVCTHFSALMFVTFLAVSLFLVCIELRCTNVQPTEDAISLLLGSVVRVVRPDALSSLASSKGRCLPPAYFKIFKKFLFILGLVKFDWCVSLVMLFGICLESWIINKLIVLLWYILYYI